MATLTPEKVYRDVEVAEVLPRVRDGKLHKGPVSRLLASISKVQGEYVDYQMEAGVWRKLAL